eukprot:SM000162S02388  [mRNA]  locus=s162:212978:217544:- [translate_table: standard]
MKAVATAAAAAVPQLWQEENCRLKAESRRATQYHRQQPQLDEDNDGSCEMVEDVDMDVRPPSDVGGSSSEHCCQVCSRSFTTGRALGDHMVVHRSKYQHVSGAKDCLCVACDRQAVSDRGGMGTMSVGVAGTGQELKEGTEELPALAQSSPPLSSATAEDIQGSSGGEVPLQEGEETGNGESTRKSNSGRGSGQSGPTAPPHGCSECGLAFQTWRALELHMAAHDGEDVGAGALEQATSSGSDVAGWPTAQQGLGAVVARAAAALAVQRQELVEQRRQQQAAAAAAVAAAAAGEHQAVSEESEAAEEGAAEDEVGEAVGSEEEGVLYGCPQCHKDFSSRVELAAHRRDHELQRQRRRQQQQRQRAERERKAAEAGSVPQAGSFRHRHVHRLQATGLLSAAAAAKAATKAGGVSAANIAVGIAAISGGAGSGRSGGGGSVGVGSGDGRACTCTECGRHFHSWKALFGHMRCHPEREWRGILRPDGDQLAGLASSQPRRRNAAAKLRAAGKAAAAAAASATASAAAAVAAPAVAAAEGGRVLELLTAPKERNSAKKRPALPPGPPKIRPLLPKGPVPPKLRGLLTSSDDEETESEIEREVPHPGLAAEGSHDAESDAESVESMEAAYLQDRAVGSEGFAMAAALTGDFAERAAAAAAVAAAAAQQSWMTGKRSKRPRLSVRPPALRVVPPNPPMGNVPPEEGVAETPMAVREERTADCLVRLSASKWEVVQLRTEVEAGGREEEEGECGVQEGEEDGAEDDEDDGVDMDRGTDNKDEEEGSGSGGHAKDVHSEHRGWSGGEATSANERTRALGRGTAGEDRVRLADEAGVRDELEMEVAEAALCGDRERMLKEEVDGHSDGDCRGGNGIGKAEASVWSDDAAETTAMVAEAAGKYQCHTCRRVFRSHQALGGHRASHKKLRGCFPVAAGAASSNSGGECGDALPNLQAAAAAEEEPKQGQNLQLPLLVPEPSASALVSTSSAGEAAAAAALGDQVLPLPPLLRRSGFDHEQRTLLPPPPAQPLVLPPSPLAQQDRGPVILMGLEQVAAVSMPSAAVAIAPSRKHSNQGTGGVASSISNGANSTVGGSKSHVCSICQRSFASGQALGGHKRCHFMTAAGSSPERQAAASATVGGGGAAMPPAAVTAAEVPAEDGTAAILMRAEGLTFRGVPPSMTTPPPQPSHLRPLLPSPLYLATQRLQTPSAKPPAKAGAFSDTASRAANRVAGAAGSTNLGANLDGTTCMKLPAVVRDLPRSPRDEPLDLNMPAQDDGDGSIGGSSADDRGAAGPGAMVLKPSAFHSVLPLSSSAAATVKGLPLVEAGSMRWGEAGLHWLRTSTHFGMHGHGSGPNQYQHAGAACAAEPAMAPTSSSGAMVPAMVMPGIMLAPVSAEFDVLAGHFAAHVGSPGRLSFVSPHSTQSAVPN